MNHTITTPLSQSQALDALKTAIAQQGMTLFAVIDHQAAARKAGLDMQPAAVLIYGNPKAGTPLRKKIRLLRLPCPCAYW